eukprot:scaffold442_cov53-Phaeocystis_antarctica.AAC.1
MLCAQGHLAGWGCPDRARIRDGSHVPNDGKDESHESGGAERPESGGVAAAAHVCVRPVCSGATSGGDNQDIPTGNPHTLGAALWSADRRWPPARAPVEYWRRRGRTLVSRLGEHQQMTTTRKRRIIRIPVPVTDSGGHLSKASKPSPQPGKCAKNHTLRRAAAEEGLSCDACNRALHCGDTIWCCKPCDYDQCSGCTRAPGDSSPPTQHAEA